MGDKLNLKRVRHVVAAVILLGFLVAEKAPAAPQERWTHYKNERWGFCVDIPQNWERSEGVDKAGIVTSPRIGRERGDVSIIEVGARTNQPSEKTAGRMQTLDEIFTGTPDVLGKIQNVRLVNKKRIVFQENAAIYATINYQLNGEDWVAENISFLTPQGTVYLLEMRCRRTQLKILDRIFRRMAFDGFRLHCG